MQSDIQPSPSGIITLNKPADISSFGALNRVKRLLAHKTKIGHAGTLDPFATGVLLLLIGKATKWCESLMDSPKQYEATIKLGAKTASYDVESPEEIVEWDEIPKIDEITELYKQFTGTIQQIPPVFSALKINGKRACDRVRDGEIVELKSRTVQIYNIELIDYNWPFLKLRIDCGRGTYIRSLAHDIGATLGTGGYLVQLCRTGVGRFNINHSYTLEELSGQDIQSKLLDIDGNPIAIPTPRY